MEDAVKKYNDLLLRWCQAGSEIRELLKNTIKETGTINFDYPVRVVVLDDESEEYIEVEVFKLQYNDWGDVQYAMHTDDDKVYSVDDMRDCFCVDVLESMTLH